MGGRGGGSPATRQSQGPPASAPAMSGNLDDRVLSAIRSLSGERDQGMNLVSLVRLRDRLSDVDRDDLDRILKTMDRARVIQLSPDPNRKALPPEARRDALRLGGGDQHFVSIMR